MDLVALAVVHGRDHGVDLIEFRVHPPRVQRLVHILRAQTQRTQVSVQVQHSHAEGTWKTMTTMSLPRWRFLSSCCLSFGYHGRYGATWYMISKPLNLVCTLYVPVVPSRIPYYATGTSTGIDGEAVRLTSRPPLKPSKPFRVILSPRNFRKSSKAGLS